MLADTFPLAPDKADFARVSSCFRGAEPASDRSRSNCARLAGYRYIDVKIRQNGILSGLIHVRIGMIECFGFQGHWLL